MGDPLTGHPSADGVADWFYRHWPHSIISHTAPSIKRTHMELGGKAPVIVLMMRILKLWSKVYVLWYYNAGQDCTAACRIYAQKRHLRYAGGKLGAAVATLKSGSPDDEPTELGVSLAHLERASARR